MSLHTEPRPSARKYDTPTLTDFLLRIFGEDCRDLIHTTLTDLEAENADRKPPDGADTAATPVENTALAREHPTGRPSAEDPFKALGDELDGEGRHTYHGIFKRREPSSS